MGIWYLSDVPVFLNLLSKLKTLCTEWDIIECILSNQMYLWQRMYQTCLLLDLAELLWTFLLCNWYHHVGLYTITKHSYKMPETFLRNVFVIFTAQINLLNIIEALVLTYIPISTTGEGTSVAEICRRPDKNQFSTCSNSQAYILKPFHISLRVAFGLLSICCYTKYSLHINQSIYNWYRPT